MRISTTYIPSSRGYFWHSWLKIQDCKFSLFSRAKPTKAQLRKFKRNVKRDNFGLVANERILKMDDVKFLKEESPQ